MAEPIPRTARLGTRLGVAFTATAVGAVVVAMALAWATTAPRVDRLGADQRGQVVDDVTAALATAYLAVGGWDGADLLPAHALAAAAGAVLTVSTDTGAVLPVPDDVPELTRRLRQRSAESPAPAPTAPTSPEPTTDTHVPPVDDHSAPSGTPSGEPNHSDPAPGTPGGGDHGPTEHRSSGGDRVRGASLEDPSPIPPADPPRIEATRTADVVVGDRVVGRATLQFTASDRPDAMATFRQALLDDLIVAGLAAALLGTVVALLVAPRLTRPLRRLTIAVDRVAGGDRSARTDVPGAVGELGVLARAVDRMAADLEREDRLRRALVADVAHEVRTPLTILLGEVEALEDGVVPADPQRLASLHEEVLRLARLVEDLDAIAAAEAAGARLHRELVDLATVVRAALSGLAEQLATAGVEVAATLEPATVTGDAHRLEQVVRNLVTNAAKFSPRGGTVSVDVGVEGDTAVLRVTDDGEGIPAADLPHVFDRFWRGQSAHGTPGSGIGLAVVAELVAAHGGQVEASNAPPRGARLTIRLPLAPRPTGATGERPDVDGRLVGT